jgi:hypothetical protein
MGNIVIKLIKDLLRIIIRNKKNNKFQNNHITLNIIKWNLMSINNEKNSKYENQTNNL